MEWATRNDAKENRSLEGGHGYPPLLCHKNRTCFHMTGKVLLGERDAEEFLLVPPRKARSRASATGDKVVTEG